MPTVSVIITTFNGGKRGFLKDSIESVLLQTYTDFELLIVDDGSTDETESICKQYLTDSRVRYIHQENKGISGARNTGIRNSNGAYVCFLDDDDQWLPEKLEKQIELFKTCKDPKIGMVHMWVLWVDVNGEKIGSNTHITQGNIRSRLFKQNIINATSSVMIKREVFDKVGCFRSHMIHVEDYEFWFRIAKEFHIYSVNEPLVLYRVHHVDKLSECYKKNIIYSQLVLYYAFEDDKLSTFIDEQRAYNLLYKRFAEHQFAICDYQEFRKYCRLAKAYGSLGNGLRLRYWLSHFPKLLGTVKQARGRG